jgi:hypothetical protein
MGIVNWRNALVGWATVKVGKRVVKGKAKSALPSRKEPKRGLGLPAAVSGVAAAAGGVWLFLRRRGRGDRAAGK